MSGAFSIVQCGCNKGAEVGSGTNARAGTYKLMRTSSCISAQVSTPELVRMSLRTQARASCQRLDTQAHKSRSSLCA